MLKCVCDLCSKDLGPVTQEGAATRQQLKVSMDNVNMFIGDVCPECLERFRNFLNLPKKD